ncbi:MAG: NAD(P)/FAD-dependent oxidoreductase [Desulfonatronovibrionaceae bacterium]
MQEVDALVVGGGPAGMTAALYLLRSGVNLGWAERMAPGGQVLLTEKIENYPGFPESVHGFELVDKFVAHLEGFEYTKFSDEVQEIKLDPGNHQVLAGDAWVRAGALVLCTGAKWRKLGVPGEGRLTGRGVSYCAICDGNFFRGQEVACIGGGDTALEESLYLSRIVDKIHLIHRRDKFRGAQVYVDKVMANDKIELHLDTVVEEFFGESDLESLHLRNAKTGETSDLPVSGAFVFIGVEPESEFIPDDVVKDGQGFVVTDAEMRCSVDGVFAAGDIRSKLCRQISTAVGDGATAAHNANLYLEKLHA